MAERRGGDLFIVDNSVEGWTGQRYLQEWCDLAKSFDIATGFFEIGSLLALDGKWQGLEKIRILMGGDVTAATKKMLLEAVRNRATSHLDASLEEDKDENPFLNGVPAILEALKSRQIEARVYNREKFHAKAYITHAKMDVIGAQALVGSSNFTRPGLTQNVELNIQVQSGREVEQLQNWFDAHWKLAEEVTEDVIQVVERHIAEFTPFDLYARALSEFFAGHELTAGEWESTQSLLFPKLDRYQQEGYWALMKIARQFGGAFLCDGVGLGKTFIGMMLIERLIQHDKKRVVLLAPKTAKESVWEPHLRQWIPEVGGTGGGADFSNLAVFSHTDLSRGGDFPDRFRRIAQQADVIIVDEAHHFRNRGRRSPEGSGRADSRYFELFDLLDPVNGPKTVFFLTATPINNSLNDFRHLLELFTREDDTYFARTLGINSVRGHFNELTRSLESSVAHVGPAALVVDTGAEATDVLAKDSTFQHLVVQRSRRYARESQERQGNGATVFPEREAPVVAEYSIRKTYGELLDMVEKAFAKDTPLFSLPIYYPLAYYKGPNTKIDPLEENRQRQVVGLIRTQFLKRFESSVQAFELSCDRLLRRLLAFLEVNCSTESERKILDRWKAQHADVLGHAAKQMELVWGDTSAEDDEEEDDIVPPEMIAALEPLSREDYKVEEIISETILDLGQIVDFLQETRKFQPSQDDKLRALMDLLKTKELVSSKVLVFTEFADTAKYLERELVKAGVKGVEELDSLSKSNRTDVIRRFAPYYNGSSSAEIAKGSKPEIRVLISTDVLSEGLNLQDATRMMNYDIHWNPVRLMQRIGRVDRRLNPAVEASLIADHPGEQARRGHVKYWNFLPPDELNALLSLYTRVSHKTLIISKTLGIEGKRLLRPEDDFDALKDFNHLYEGTKTVVEDMRLEYQQLLDDVPGLAARIAAFPGSMFSGKRREPSNPRAVFLCYALPALDAESGLFTEAAGARRWYLADLDSQAILEEPSEIVSVIRSEPSTPRLCELPPDLLVDARARVVKHIKNGYLKRIDAPVGVKPALKCWMEIGGG